MAASYLKQQFSIAHHLVPTLEDTAGPALASHRPQHRCPAPAWYLIIRLHYPFTVSPVGGSRGQS